jgi:hypothetical protein
MTERSVARHGVRTKGRLAVLAARLGSRRLATGESRARSQQMSAAVPVMDPVARAETAHAATVSGAVGCCWQARRGAARRRGAPLLWPSSSASTPSSHVRARPARQTRPSRVSGKRQSAQPTPAETVAHIVPRHEYPARRRSRGVVAARTFSRARVCEQRWAFALLLGPGVKALVMSVLCPICPCIALYPKRLRSDADG